MTIEELNRAVPFLNSQLRIPAEFFAMRPAQWDVLCLGITANVVLFTGTEQTPIVFQYRRVKPPDEWRMGDILTHARNLELMVSCAFAEAVETKTLRTRDWRIDDEVIPGKDYVFDRIEYLRG